MVVGPAARAGRFGTSATVDQAPWAWCSVQHGHPVLAAAY